MEKLIETFAHAELGLGKVSFAIRVKDGDNKVSVGCALMAPQEIFNKARGRMIALNRLNSKRGFYFEFERNAEEKLKKQVYDKMLALVRMQID